MDAKQLFFERYRGFQEYPEHLVAGLTEDQLRHSPQPELNPIVWTLWHMARCEDVGVNRILTDQVQVLDTGAEPMRLGVDSREMGTGMSKAAVRHLSETIDVSALEKYRTEVTRRTESSLELLPLSDLRQELARVPLRRVLVDEGAGGEVGESIVESYCGHTKGWLLGHLVLTHNYYHIGQAFAVRSLLGVANPW